MVSVVCQNERIISQTKSEQAVFDGEHAVRITKSERCRPQLNDEGYALQRSSTSLINGRPSNDMRIDHRNIERRHEDIFIRYSNEPFIRISATQFHKKGGTCIVALTIGDDPFPKTVPFGWIVVAVWLTMFSRTV